MNIIPITADNLSRLKVFDDDVLELDCDNPFVTSIRHHYYLLDGITSKPQTSYFFLFCEDGTPVGRCGIQLDPPEDDICGYGEDATILFHQHKLVSFVGDLVHPDYRGHGIQQAMIEYRKTFLPAIGYDHAVAGIIDGNDASRHSYEKCGFAPIGRKNLSWADPVTLLLYDATKRPR